MLFLLPRRTLPPFYGRYQQMGKRQLKFMNEFLMRFFPRLRSRRLLRSTGGDRESNYRAEVGLGGAARRIIFRVK